MPHPGLRLIFLLILLLSPLFFNTFSLNCYSFIDSPTIPCYTAPSAINILTKYVYCICFFSCIVTYRNCFIVFLNIL